MDRLGNEENVSCKKSTLYYRSEFGSINKVECKSVMVYRRPWAQYESAVDIYFTPKGARRERRVILAYKAYAIVLEGYGHADPDSMCTWKKSEATEAMIGHGRHSSCSDGWTTDFDRIIERYVNESGAKVAGDWRNVNTHDKDTAKAFQEAQKQSVIEQLQASGVAQGLAEEAGRLHVYRSPYRAAAFLANDNGVHAWVSEPMTLCVGDVKIQPRIDGCAR